MSTTAPPASPDAIFNALFAFQQTAALKTAIDLDLFTAIGDGARTAPAVAGRIGAVERGATILCDYLVTLGFLEKSDGMYALTPMSSAFLNRRSPMYMGSVASFLTRPELKHNFENLTEAVKTGTIRPEANTVSYENPIWVEFARAMVPMAVPAAHAIAQLLGVESMGRIKVLDIAAGHGMYGIVLAQRNPTAEIYAADWAPVLRVAEAHATDAGVQQRYHTIPGDAFETDFGTGYDVALVTNFLHHFNPAQCTRFLGKVAAALRPSGRVVLVEFVPNADRVTPVMAARFSLTALAGTEGGNAYTMAELSSMLESAGFSGVEAHPLPTPQTVIVARK